MTRVFPILATLYSSFYEGSLIDPLEEFVGFSNFIELVNERNFQTALKNNVIFTASFVPSIIGLSLSLAILLNRKIKFKSFFETVYFLPFVLPLVPVCVIWIWIYNPQIGLINYVLSRFNISPKGWLIDPQIALFSIVVMSVWKYLGYYIIIFLVALRNVPQSYYEAASMDGGNAWQILRWITIPTIRPILLFATVICTATSFQFFTQFYVMSKGGAVGGAGAEVRNLVYDMYENAFFFGETGYAYAEAVILLLLVFCVTILEFKIFKTE